ncbi:hypothetical protein CASFOL_010838 [Castilleja foliolosa]|uniref:Pre-mRNA polyadenylation factor Fip1 domain-containing protein n=1 Tax=Castilleja foliolosa TaxID=1961234 RepID=A0ABD3DTS3_9LAMI
MEANVVNIAGDEFGMLCAEILENWNSPSLGNSSSVHQNPFSQFNPSPYDDIIQSDTNDTHYSPLQPLYYTTNVETKNEGLEHKEEKPMKRAGYEKEGEDENKGMEHKEDKTMKTACDEEEGEFLEHKEDKTMKTTGYEEEDDDDDSDDEEDNFRIILNQNDAFDPPSQCNFFVNKPVPATSGSCSVAKFKFVTPFNKTIFDINIDHISEKLWRNPGVDTSDFFNYGLDEKKWKDYCKLIMRTKVKAGSGSRQSAMNADKHKQSPKERDTDEVKVDRAKIDECLNLADAKDPKLYDLNVIIEIAIRDSASEKTPIKGEKILPFPMDSYSSEYLKFDAIKLDMAIDDCLNFADSEDLSLHDSDVIIEIICETAQPLSDSDTPRHIKSKDNDECGDCRYKRPMWRKERDYYSSRQENRKRGKFNDAISHQKIEEDPEKLKRRRERFEVPLSNVKNGIVANKSNVLKLTTNSDIKDQRPTRTRKWRIN